MLVSTNTKFFLRIKFILAYLEVGSALTIQKIAQAKLLILSFKADISIFVLGYSCAVDDSSDIDLF